MGNEGARAVRIDKAATTIEESVEGVTATIYSSISQFPTSLSLTGAITQIDKSTRQTASGPLRNFEGKEIPWLKLIVS